MKKLIIILGSITLGTTAVAVPAVFVMRGFSNSLNKKVDHANPQDSDIDTNVSSSNQGFLDVTTLDITSILGAIESPSEENVIAKLKEVNPQLKDLNIYIKGLTLSKVRFTVEKYTGTAEAAYKITSLDSLIANKDLGKVAKITDEAIINKIKEKNKIISNTDLSSEIKLQVISLNQIEMDWVDARPDSNSKITLTYEPMSLEGIFLNTNLGDTSDLSSEWISKTLLHVNPQASFIDLTKDYQIKIYDEGNQSPENAKIQLFYQDNLVSLDAGNFLTVTYNVKDITSIITNTDLGVLEKLDRETILAAIIVKNPIYGNLRNYRNTQIDFTLGSAKVSNPGVLTDTATVTYQIRDISGIVSKTHLGELELLPADTATLNLMLIKKIKEVNPVLRELVDFNIKPEAVAYNSFVPADAYVRNNKFDISIVGYQGKITMSFDVKRKNISELLRTTDLRTFYWTTKDDILKRIKNENGAGFNDEEIDYSEPSYTNIVLTAKNSSINYYGSVTITFNTNFKKTTDHNMTNFKGGTGDGEQFNAMQTIEWAVMSQNKTATNSSFDFSYVIPNGLNNAILAGKKNIVLSYQLRPNSISTFQSVSATELEKAKQVGDLQTPLSLLNGAGIENKDLGTAKSIWVPFESRNWWGSCGKMVMVEM
ncbi:hypothetical protein SCLARK_001754 [Spiroplasma clarkii]|uniref:hypothetical protein n=1 Tax=Spiroplasma clarkii TaxID=2139 RepID=UPI000B54EA2B|nr:hypothetical protein [Spiroplasma clarkii]ARU92207.1 hypothetical protein SCLARK_001754 [Spiroplasma clarkii]